VGAAARGAGLAFAADASAALPLPDKALRLANAKARPLNPCAVPCCAMLSPVSLLVLLDIAPRVTTRITARASDAALINHEGDALALGVVVVTDQPDVVIRIGTMAGLEFGRDPVQILFAEERQFPMVQ